MTGIADEKRQLNDQQVDELVAAMTEALEQVVRDMRAHPPERADAGDPQSLSVQRQACGSWPHAVPQSPPRDERD
jgi:hypothetical protein